MSVWLRTSAFLLFLLLSSGVSVAASPAQDSAEHHHSATATGQAYPAGEEHQLFLMVLKQLYAMENSGELSPENSKALAYEVKGALYDTDKYIKVGGWGGSKLQSCVRMLKNKNARAALLGILMACGVNLGIIENTDMKFIGNLFRQERIRQREDQKKQSKQGQQPTQGAPPPPDSKKKKGGK